LSQTFSAIYSGYFGDGGVMICSPELALNRDPPNLYR
jgi:hypothetical protein